jgi:hypothetical protein
MVDFAKLRDPEWQAKVRQEREAEEAQREAHDKKLRAAVELCMMKSEDLAENERSLVRNCRMRLNTYQAVSEKQEKWLLDVALREQIKTAKLYAGGDVDGEHPTHLLTNWPHAKEFDGASCGYWAWVLHQVEVHGY